MHKTGYDPILAGVLRRCRQSLSAIGVDWRKLQLQAQWPACVLWGFKCETPTAVEVAWEQQGENVLILRWVESGHPARYELEYRWLSDPTDTTAVKGQDFTYWTPQEARPMLTDGLFASVYLF